jgi:uncharacterized protein (DUF2236 family)
MLRSTSVSDRVNGERLVLLGWSRAILLQIAHPLIAAGVAEHSAFRDSPLAAVRRLRQTVRAMLGLVFGNEAEQSRVIGGIRMIHRRVHGTLNEPVGRFSAGTSYSAEDPDLLLWVHATLLESTLLVHDMLVAPLTDADRDAYCREAAWVALALGAREHEVPREWTALTTYMNTMLQSGLLQVGPDARALAAALLGGRLSRLTGPVAWANYRLTAGWLPPGIRAQYGFAWTPWRGRQFGALVTALRLARKMAPRSLALWPEARSRTAEERSA